MAGTTEAGVKLPCLLHRQEGDPNLACGQVDRILDPTDGSRRNACQSGDLPHTLAGGQFLSRLLHLGFAKRRPTEPDGQASCRSLTSQYTIPTTLPQMCGQHSRHIEQ